MGRAKLTPREESLKPVIAGNIKKYLDEFNKKPADLQRGTGIAQSTISDYTSGKTLVNPGNVEKIASFFGVLKSDIDPRFSDEWVNENEFPIIEQTVETMKKLEEPRQQVVLDTASSQLKEQIEKKRLSFFSKKIDFDKITNVFPYDPDKEGYAPVIGEIAAGTPILAEENFEGMRPVYGKYAGRDDVFWIRVKGESMETEIHDGSFALILQDPNLADGSIGAVRFTDDNCATLKCVYYEYDENGYPLRMRLEPLNPDYPIQYADEYNPAEIEGRLVKVEQDY